MGKNRLMLFDSVEFSWLGNFLPYIFSVCACITGTMLHGKVFEWNIKNRNRSCTAINRRMYCIDGRSGRSFA